MSLSQYEIITKLGSGSFGIVYKAKLKKSNQLCVIKEIQISKLDARLKKWAMNQAKLMKEINSPYIVKYFNSFLDKTKLYIVMEHCVKGDLAKFMKGQMGKPLKQQTIWKFTIQIMIGLRDLHSKKILHRDIKTLNIFLDENFNVRVGDLGVAKTMSTDFTNTVVGTPYYLSPQMCQQKPYNQKTDIWAFGCLVYELCTGKHPFQAQNQAALALKIVMGKFQDIPSIYSKQLRWLIQSCLSVDYKRRPSINYLLQRPQIIEHAKKLNIILNSSSQINKKSQISNLNQVQQKKQVSRKSIEIKQIVEKATKKVEDNIKKVPHNNQKSNEKNKTQNKKPSPSINYSSKQLQIVSNNSRKSQQKRKQIQKQKSNLPPKQISSNQQIKKQKDSKQVPTNKNLSRQKSKQKIVVKIPSVPPANVVKNKYPSQVIVKQSQQKNTNKNKQIPQSSAITNNFNKNKDPQNNTNKINSVKIKQQGVKPVQKKQDIKKIQQKRPSVSIYDEIKTHQLKKQFNQQDKKNILEDQSFLIEDMSLLDITKMKRRDSSLEEQRIKQQKQKQKNAKKAAFVSSKVQQQIDDDMLMAEFGITPQKKQVLNDFSLLKTKSINWDLQVSSNLNKTNNESKSALKQGFEKTPFKQLPTIKMPNQPSQQLSVLIQNHNYFNKNGKQHYQQNEEEHQQNIEQDDNQPYKSDDDQNSNQQNSGSQNKKQKNQSKNKQYIGDQVENQFPSDDQDSRYLIQNIEAQFQQQGRQSTQKNIELYSKKLLQNQKRMIHLQNSKDHTEKQYFSHLPKQAFNKLKQKMNQQNESEVDKLMKQLTKGKQYLVMKFLKIVGFDIEIQICDKNIKQCRLRINQLKNQLQKGVYY